MSKPPLEMPEEPGTDATPAQREKYRRDKEMFLTEGMKPIAKATPQDTAVAKTTLDRLQALRKSPAGLLDIQAPVKAALWLALLRPAKDVLFEAEMMRRFRLQQIAGDGSDALPPTMPAIIALGNELVAAALSGDGGAIKQVADRIEGTPGLRQGDADPEDPARQRQTRAIIERVTRAMNAKRIDKIVDAEYTEVKETKE